MGKNWSVYQQAIFQFVETPNAGNAIVEAVAGSGKSTTIIECLNRIPGNKTSIFLAFNKTIAEELKARGVNARTFHSLTYGPVTKFKNTRQVESNKLRILLEENFKGETVKMYGTFAARLVGLARQSGMGFLLTDTDQHWYDIVAQHDLEPESDEADIGVGIETARTLLRMSNESPMVDFDDLLYLAVKEGLSLPRFDFVFVDEAQDTNAIQRALLRKITGDRSRVIAVGDPAQAIYGFRGADSNSLNLIAEEFNCKRLPLTVSYRCSHAVIDYAHKWVDHIEAGPNAAEGEVIDLGTKWKIDSTFSANDLVVCRNTKPLIQLGYRLLKARVPARILGREIGQGLKSLINKMKAQDVDHLIQRLGVWVDRETQKALVKMQDDKVEAIHDKADAVFCLIEGLDEADRSISALLKVIDQLFSEGTNVVTLSTIHKAKGLEAHRVFWLNRSLCPSKWARQNWQKQQEANLCYVAVTRAIDTLVIIEDREPE